MKQFLSIALLACFAMYHFGYYALYFSMDQHLESKWEDMIYGEKSIYAEETLIEIPLSAPYMANQEEFKPTNASFEKDGQFFRAIKQRYQNDTLQIIVVRDTARGLLDNTVKRWISFISEDELPQDYDGTTSMKLFAKDYIQSAPFLFEAYSNITSNSGLIFFTNIYLDPEKGIFSPPPQVS